MPAPRSAAVALAVLTAAQLTCSPLLMAVAAADEKLKSLQQQVDELKKQMDQSKQAPAPTAPTAPGLLTDFKIGGYGSVRFEASDLDNVGNTFTFRRFVLATDATDRKSVV